MKLHTLRSSAGLAAGVVTGLALAAAISFMPGRAALAEPTALKACPSSALTAGRTPGLSPMTGEHGSFYVITNGSRSSCTLAGYPAVTLYAGKQVLPFNYRHGGRPYVTSARPVHVTLRPGGSAWILVAKYRCDLGDMHSAGVIRLSFANATVSTLTSQIPVLVAELSYCRGGARDPGNIVTVSPVEPSKRATLPS